MSIDVLAEPQPADNNRASLREDMREVRWRLDHLTDSLRDADAQADDLARLLIRIDRGIALLARAND